MTWKSLLRSDANKDIKYAKKVSNKRSMTEFTVLIKEKAKKRQGYPTRPWERINEWQ